MSVINNNIDINRTLRSIRICNIPNILHVVPYSLPSTLNALHILNLHSVLILNQPTLKFTLAIYKELNI